MTIVLRRPWTRQPQGVARIAAPFAGMTRLLLTPQQQASTLQLTTGTVTKAASPGGVGYSYGSGNYHSFAPGGIRDSAGSGNDPTVNWSLSVSFVVSSNAALDAIFSIGASPTDGGPVVLAQNNSGTLRVYVSAIGGYTDVGPAVIGKLHTITHAYSDISPYPSSIYLDGRLIASGNGYRFWSGPTLYIGSGYPSQTANATILQALLLQGRGGDTALKDDHNPWKIFEPKRIQIPIVAAAAPAVPSITALSAENITAISANYRVTLDYA